MAELLEKTQSSYFPAFKKIFKDVVAGRFFSGILTSGGFLSSFWTPCGPIKLPQQTWVPDLNNQIEEYDNEIYLISEALIINSFSSVLDR